MGAPSASVTSYTKWCADTAESKRVVFHQLYARELAKVAHHLPGTACEPFVFSSLGAHTPSTLRRLPRGDVRKGLFGAASHARETGLQAISSALFSSVLARFNAFQDRSSGFGYDGPAAAPIPVARERQFARPRAAVAAFVAAPHLGMAGGAGAGGAVAADVSA